jgi:hypothetical protein
MCTWRSYGARGLLYFVAINILLRWSKVAVSSLKYVVATDGAATECRPYNRATTTSYSCTVGASACGTKHMRQRASYLSEAPTATRSSDSKVRCE